MEIFWKTIAQYNTSTWLFQILLTLTGIALTILLVRRPSPKTKMAMKLFLIILHVWVAVVYYYIYCAERNYSNILTLFWGIMAIIWIWDLATGYTPFIRRHKYDFLAYLLLSMPFIYPAFSLLRGLSFPEITSPVMPCSVAVFTIGLLLLFSQKVNMLTVLFLSHWAIIGISKTYFFNIPEDFLLAGASIPALYLFFREYYARDLHRDQKPEARYMNTILILLCIIIGIGLTTTLWSNFIQQ